MPITFGAINKQSLAALLRSLCDGVASFCPSRSELRLTTHILCQAPAIASDWDTLRLS